MAASDCGAAKTQFPEHSPSHSPHLRSWLLCSPSLTSLCPVWWLHVAPEVVSERPEAVQGLWKNLWNKETVTRTQRRVGVNTNVPDSSQVGREVFVPLELGYILSLHIPVLSLSSPPHLQFPEHSSPSE